MLHKLVAIAGILLILAIVWDAFEALVLPRTATRRRRKPPTRALSISATRTQCWRSGACLRTVTGLPQISIGRKGYCKEWLPPER